jgi:hypothetical protein
MDCCVKPAKKQDVASCRFSGKDIEPYETFKSVDRIGLVGFNTRTLTEKPPVEHPTHDP